MRLLIVSHTSHYNYKGKFTGWGPTVREIDYLVELFDEVVHLAPLHTGPPPPSALPYSSPQVRLKFVRPAGGNNLSKKLEVAGVTPLYIRAIAQEMKAADIVHVRCPANISMITILLLAFSQYPLFRWVKYAGNWRPEGREPWTYTFQRWYLHRGLHRGIATVNGHWPNQPGHIYSFLNPSFTQDEVENARNLGADKELRTPINLLFVGRVEAAKGAGRALRIAHELRVNKLPFKLDFIGDGPERTSFEKWSKSKHLNGHVCFHGWLPREKISAFYREAHFILLPTSASEGWPKVLSEAMAFGGVPLAGAVSSIPQILTDLGAGKALPSDNPSAFVEAILKYVEQPDEWKAASRAGLKAAPLFTYEHYLTELGRVFKDAWGLSLRDASIKIPSY